MKNYLLVIVYLIGFKFALAQISNGNVSSELNVETVDKISFITAKVSNKTELYFNLKYNFSVFVLKENYKPLKESLEQFLKSPESESKTLRDFLKAQEENKYASKDFKEEYFTLNPYETKDLYKVSIEAKTQDEIIVLFLIFDDEEKIVAKSRVVLNDRKKTTNNISAKSESNKSFQILGLVVEDTKTKSGKDFYDRFFFHYNYSNIKGNQVVKVKEMFSFRRTTRLIVSVGDDVIAEFFAYPNEEYIEEIAKISVQRVYKYFENKKKEKLYISQY